jgi:hypothetical protein
VVDATTRAVRLITWGQTDVYTSSPAAVSGCQTTCRQATGTNPDLSSGHHLGCQTSVSGRWRNDGSSVRRATATDAVTGCL